jgi:hypothetical protein
MTFLNVHPALVAAAAQDIRAIGAAIGDATSYASAPTTTVLPAGADQVSAAFTEVLNSHGSDFRAISGQAQLFHQQFTANLAAGTQAFTHNEQSAVQSLVNTGSAVEDNPLLLSELAAIDGPAPKNTPPLPVTTNSSVALLLGGTGFPFPDANQVALVKDAYLPGMSGVQALPLETPEEFWPFTPLFGNLTLGQSVSQGTVLLNSAISQELAGGNRVLVVGISQSATIETAEIRNLMATGSPDTNRLSFVLVGDPNNPDGGILERFDGAYVPVFDVPFNGATPPNSPYHVAIYTGQYDGVSDFPQYPLNLISDLNAVAGTEFVQNAVLLPTSPGYTGDTTYYLGLTQNLPLLDLIRVAPYGTAVADLLQPDLRVIVDMGYDNGYANIPTPASLIEFPNWPAIGTDLLHGTGQGIRAAGVDLGWLPPQDYPIGHYPFSPVADPGLNYPQPQTGITGLSRVATLQGQLMNALGLVPPWDDISST